MFSNGDPLYAVCVAVALFLACMVASRLRAVAPALDRALAGLARWVRKRGLFTIEDRFVEQRRIDVLRVVLGLLVAWRARDDLATILIAGDPLPIALSATALVLSLLVTVGLGTPVAALVFALLVNLVIDGLAGSSNLESMVLAILLTVFAYAPAGRTLSMDAWLMRQPGLVGAAIRSMYRLFGPFTTCRASLVKGWALVAFAAISFHASLLHLQEEAWRSGALNAWLLLAPRTNAWFHEQADWLYRTSPFAYVTFARASTWGMLIWELTMLPLILLGRWSRIMAVTWGVLFAAVSVAVLPLRMLGWYELVLWAVLFMDLPLGGRPARDSSTLAVGILGRANAPGPSTNARTVGFTSAVRAFALFATVLLAAYLVRMPLARDLPGVRVAASWSRALVGQAPLALGLGPVDVYNDVQFAGGRLTTRSWWSDGRRMIDSSVVGPFVTAPDGQEAARHLRTMAIHRAPCGDKAFHAYLTRYGERYVDHLPPARSPSYVFLTEFVYSEWPTVDDFAVYRYRPIESTVVCRLTSEVGSGQTPTLTITERGIDILTREAGLPFKPRHEWAPLLYDFPCLAEVQRLSWWFDRPNLAPRGPEAETALRRVLSDVSTKNPLRCFAEVDATLAGMDLDWRAENLPPPAPCGPDFGLAHAYATIMEGYPLVHKIAVAVERARAAQARDDHAACLLATAEARRLYVNAIRLGT